MFGLIAVMLLQIAPADAMKPGARYYWSAPCTVMAADPANPVEQFATEYLGKIGAPLGIIRCVQPEGRFAPVFMTDPIEGVGLVIIYSEEFEKSEFPQLALRGLVAHEVAHVVVQKVCTALPTLEEYVACESEVDREAARLSSVEAVSVAITAYHRLYLHMTAGGLAEIRRRLLDERLPRLQEGR